MEIDEYYLRCSRKRKRDNYDNYHNNYRKRKFEEDSDDIIINKFQKMDIINDNKIYIINNKKRIYDEIVDIFDITDINIKLQIKKQKINKTYNCTLHDDTKEICLIYNCLGNININNNILYNYIK